jgi:hypothetical protein
VWLVAIALTLGGLTALAFASRAWRHARHVDLGYMSHQWLAEHRAGSR